MRRDHQRHLGDEGGVALLAFLDRAANFEERARRHRLAYRVERAANALVHGGGFHAWYGLGLDGDGGEAAAAPDITLVEAVFELCQLAQGHGGAGRGRDLEVLQGLHARPLAALGPAMTSTR